MIPGPAGGPVEGVAALAAAGSALAAMAAAAMVTVADRMRAAPMTRDKPRRSVTRPIVRRSRQIHDRGVQGTQRSKDAGPFCTAGVSAVQITIPSFG